MTGSALPIEELRALVDAACNGSLTERDAARLEELLTGSVEAQRYYLACVRLDGCLRWEFGHQPDDLALCPLGHAPPIILDLSPALRSPLLSLHSPVGGFLFSYLGGAVLLGICLLIGWAWRIHYDQQTVQSAPRLGPVFGEPEAEPQSVGRITGLVDCQWAKWSVVSESEIRNPKSQIPNQERLVPLGAKYNLTSGFMEITYDSGAKVILQGPCTYEVESAAGGFLSLGKLTARVETRAEGGRRKAEKEARGLQGGVNRQSTINNQQSSSAFRPPPSALFSVRTPTAIVTDLGTEFGVEVDRSGISRAHVFQGKVEMRTAIDGNLPSPSGNWAGGKGGTRVIQLSANQSAEVLIGPDRHATVVRGPGRPNAFARQMPKRTPGVLGQVAKESHRRAVYRLTDLGTLGGPTSRATHVNSAGQVVGASTTKAGATHAFLYTDGAMKDLGAVGGTRE